MFKGRRVGSLTAGVAMIFFGALFLARLAFPVISLRLILSLWPVILIFLGVEIILSSIFNREEQMRYDAGSIILIFFISFFAVCMAWAEFCMEHAAQIGFRL